MELKLLFPVYFKSCSQCVFDLPIEELSSSELQQQMLSVFFLFSMLSTTKAMTRAKFLASKRFPQRCCWAVATLHRFSRLCDGQKGHRQSGARLNSIQELRLSCWFLKSDGINDCNSDRLALHLTALGVDF